MAATLFIYSLNFNIVLIWIILALLVLRLLCRKASKQLCYLLWGILAVKCLIPVSVGSTFSLIPGAEFFNVDDFNRLVFKVNSGIAPLDNIVNEYIGDHYCDGITVPSDNMLNKSEGLFFLWILGMILLIAKLLFDASRMKENLRTAVRYEENIWQSDAVSSPLVYGVIKPKIYVPFNMEPEKMQYAILHEKEHIRRGDHIWKLLAHFILILNWYNPLIWIAYKKFSDDMEMACDERVARGLNDEERKCYALTLMDCSTSRYVSLGKSLYFGKENIKERIINIVNYRATNKIVAYIAAVLIIIIAVGLLTVPDAAGHNIFNLLMGIS